MLYTFNVLVDGEKLIGTIKLSDVVLILRGRRDIIHPGFGDEIVNGL